MGRKLNAKDPYHFIQPAVTMRNRAEENRNYLSNLTLETIRYEILKASNSGKYHIEVEGWLKEAHIKYLERLGYTVELFSYSRGAMTIPEVYVSWELEEKD